MSVQPTYITALIISSSTYYIIDHLPHQNIVFLHYSANSLVRETIVYTHVHVCNYNNLLGLHITLAFKMADLRGVTSTLSLTVWTARREHRRWNVDSTSTEKKIKQKKDLFIILGRMCVCVCVFADHKCMKVVCNLMLFVCGMCVCVCVCVCARLFGGKERERVVPKQYKVPSCRGTEKTHSPASPSTDHTSSSTATHSSWTIWNAFSLPPRAEPSPFTPSVILRSTNRYTFL